MHWSTGQNTDLATFLELGIVRRQYPGRSPRALCVGDRASGSALVGSNKNQSHTRPRTHSEHSAQVALLALAGLGHEEGLRN